MEIIENIKRKKNSNKNESNNELIDWTNALTRDCNDGNFEIPVNDLNNLKLRKNVKLATPGIKLIDLSNKI